MSSPFFTSLPREIRDLIYVDALSSTTGLVTFYCDENGRGIHPSGPPLDVIPIHAFDSASNEVIYSERILLSLLQVNKQTDEECRDIFWKHNKFRPKDTHHFAMDELFAANQSLTQYFWPRLRSVELLFTPRLRQLLELRSVYNALPTLVHWSMKGCLKTVVLVMDLRKDLCERLIIGKRA